MRITVEHSAYYQNVPVADSQVHDDTDGSETPKGKVPLSKTIDATFPGYRMYRTLIDAPTTSTTDVDMKSLAAINNGREAAGLGRLPDHVNLTRLLTDAAWTEHFPLDTITKVSCDDPKWEQRLSAYFAAETETEWDK